MKIKSVWLLLLSTGLLFAADDKFHEAGQHQTATPVNNNEYAGFAFAGIEEHYEENPIRIQKAGAFEKDKKVTILVGEKVSYEITIFEDDFFDGTIINTNAKMHNRTDQKVKAIFTISFHNRSGELVARHSDYLTLNPNDRIKTGSGVIKISSKQISKITSYKLKTEVVEPE